MFIEASFVSVAFLFTKFATGIEVFPPFTMIDCPSYPTQAEAIRRLGDQFNRTRLTPWGKSLFRRWLAWTR